MKFQVLLPFRISRAPECVPVVSEEAWFMEERLGPF